MSHEEEEKVEFDLHDDMIENPEKYKKKKEPRKKRKKPLSPHYKANNEGGYGNPPVKHQFPRNNKGGGRKKGNVTLESEMRRVFRDKVPLADGTKIPAVKALAELTLKEVLSNRKVLRWGHELAAKYGPQDSDTGFLLHFELLNEDEAYIFGTLLSRVMPSSTKAEKADEEGTDEEEADEKEIKRKYMLPIYQEYRREDGQLGFKIIDEKRKRWALPEDHVLGYPRDPNHPRNWYIDQRGDGEIWRRSRNPDYPDVLIGKINRNSHLPKDHPDYDPTPDWQIDPNMVKFHFQDQGPFENDDYVESG